MTAHQFKHTPMNKGKRITNLLIGILLGFMIAAMISDFNGWQLACFLWILNYFFLYNKPSKN